MNYFPWRGQCLFSPCFILLGWDFTEAQETQSHVLNRCYLLSSVSKLCQVFKLCISLAAMHKCLGYAAPSCHCWGKKMTPGAHCGAGAGPKLAKVQRSYPKACSRPGNQPPCCLPFVLAPVQPGICPDSDLFAQTPTISIYPGKDATVIFFFENILGGKKRENNWDSVYRVSHCICRVAETIPQTVWQGI